MESLFVLQVSLWCIPQYRLVSLAASEVHSALVTPRSEQTKVTFFVNLYVILMSMFRDCTTVIEMAGVRKGNVKLAVLSRPSVRAT
jgi:hypothetical protein